MCDSCGTCLALPDKYNCGWCQSSSSCEVEDQCSGGSSSSSTGTGGSTGGSGGLLLLGSSSSSSSSSSLAGGLPGGAAAEPTRKNDWLNRSQTCPNPKINSFEPVTGPWEGGTNITIRGINLGKNFSDIYSGVKVAGITCMPYEHLYVDTKQIGCKVDSPGVQDYRKGRIVVQIADYRGESTVDYQFVDPQIEDFDPKTGPQSGGTQVTIWGRYLNAGSRIEAFIDGQPCQILSADETQALCRTSPALRPEMRGKLKMRFDDGRRECVRAEQFQYGPDPTIEYVSSGPIGQIKSPKGIPAGGIRIAVVGTQFHTVRKPRMYVYYNNMKFWSACQVLSPVEMACDSPVIDEGAPVLDPDRPLQLEYGFQMDDVQAVQNLSARGEHNAFELYPNPVYLSFEENLKFFKSEYLTINGKNLDRACKESDVQVRIGDGLCNITSLSRQQLTCRPPVEATDSNE